jgi:hypothetical protein
MSGRFKYVEPRFFSRRTRYSPDPGGAAKGLWRRAELINDFDAPHRSVVLYRDVM